MNIGTMSTNLALIIAFACMIIGFVTGSLLGYFNRNRHKKDKEETSTSISGTETSAPLADPAKFTELVRLWREKEGTKLYVETSGHLLASSNPLNPVQKKRFADLIKELADWVEIPADEIIQSHAIDLDKQSEPVIEPIASNLLPQTEPDAYVKEPAIKASVPVKTNPIPVIPPPIPAVPDPSMPVQNITPPVVLNRATQAPVRPPAEPIKKQAGSIVEQIDDILQEIIKSSDDPTRLVKLVEERQQGVIVWVGHEHFDGIDAVTDLSAKDLIRAAVKEWDRRTEIRS